MTPTLVTCYVNPDLDGVAGALAYAELLQATGRNAVAGIIGEPHPEARYILERFGIAAPMMVENADAFDDVILVDCSELGGLEGKVAPQKVVEIIDHRSVNDSASFPRARLQIELVGAAATLVAEKFIQSGVRPSKESAILLIGAIISNTLNFRASLTTDRDRAATDWLNDVAELPAEFWRELFFSKSDLSGELLAERIYNDFAQFTIGAHRVGIAQLELMGAERLIAARESEILLELRKLKEEFCLDYVFQNTIELEDARNLFVTADVDTQILLEKVLSVEFNGAVAFLPRPLMRKQLVPLLKDELWAGKGSDRNTGN